MYERIGTISEKDRIELLAEPRDWQQCKGEFADYWSDDDGARMFVKIPPKGKVHKHSDNGFKVHTVLLTNSRCESWSDGILFRLEQGGIYRLDASLPHESINWGEADRIHLISTAT